MLAFWSAISLLALVGLIYPLKMIPVLVVQLMYKMLWLSAIAVPLWWGGGIPEDLSELVVANGVGVILISLVIPWGYVLFQARDMKIPSSGPQTVSK